MIELIQPADLAVQLPAVRFLVAEFMYRRRLPEPHTQAVFDYAWLSRLRQLDERDAVLLLCDSPATADSLAPVLVDYPHLRVYWAVVNPALAPSPGSATPQHCGWDAPGTWQRVTMTDRWARIQWVLAAAAGDSEEVQSTQYTVHSEEPSASGHQLSTIDYRLSTSALSSSPVTRHSLLSPSSPHHPITPSPSLSSHLIMPAHDAVWGPGLLGYLREWSAGAAAISPVTYHQHAPVPGIGIPPDLIALLNAAFGKDTLLAWKLWRRQMQGFWGKMSLLRFDVCGPLLEQVTPCAFEDDLAIDSALAQMGTPARAVYIRDPRLYRQCLPVFTREDARRVIERILHYSLNIPGEGVSGSSLTQPLGALGQLRRLRPGWRRAHDDAAALISACLGEIQARLDRYGCSWVDWGAYRHVARPGDPCVEVWKRGSLLV